ncbi:MAG TPA: hypothetical protein QGG93_03970 [Verrucomicrobiota bacterium]|nr:hypothetical protein [Verrucomicrobiota bacterium]
MNVLFIINGLPQEDRRAREAMRIAAGIGVWGKVRPTLCFAKAGDSALGQAEDKELGHHIQLLRDTAGGLFTLAREEPDGILQHTDETGLAKLVGEADTVLHF